MSEENPVEYPDAKLLEKISGRDIHHAPQPSLTTVNNTAWATSSGAAAVHLDSSNTTRLDNMAQRILDLENILIKLGLLKHK